MSRVVELSNANTGGAKGLCLDAHDLVLSKYAAGREKDLVFNRALVAHGCVDKVKLLELLPLMPLDHDLMTFVSNLIVSDFDAAQL